MDINSDSASMAVGRALAIMEAVADRDLGLTNSEISRRLAIPKSSASYILRTLVQHGYLRREYGTGKYRLGLKLLSLVRGVQVCADLREAALPAMRRLVERSRLTAHLAVLDEGEAVYVEKVESPGFIKMDTWVGRRMMLHSTGVGKALVAYLPEAELEAMMKGRALKKKTPKTISSQSAFVQDLKKVRARGYAIDDEENSPGARCVAVPVLDNLGQALAALGVSGTTGQLDKTTVRKTAELLKEAAREISKRLGYK